MKKLFSIVIALVTVFVLCGCCISHNFVPATCTTPATCTKCGETEGEPLGHTWVEATCTTPKTCSTCGATEGEPLGHTWVEATCTTPKTCSTCEETEGEPLGHNWEEATCTEPKTCKRCDETEGKALGHTVETWETTAKPTCTELGKEEGVCTVCEETVEQDIPMVEHTPGDWVVTTPATKDSEGTHIKSCTVCGKELEKEQFTLTPEELEKQYISNCKSINYKDLSRSPNDYKGEYIKFSGRVVQVCSEADNPFFYSTYRLATSGYSNVVYIKVDNYGSGSRILEDDRITVYGTFEGLYSYETVRGDTLTIPMMIVEYYK